MKDRVEGWQEVMQDGHTVLERRFEFATFHEAMRFADRVGEVADEHDHHPEILVSWGRCVVRWWSHDAEAITDRDILLAEITNGLY